MFIILIYWCVTNGIGSLTYKKIIEKKIKSLNKKTIEEKKVMNHWKLSTRQQRSYTDNFLRR